MAAASEAMEFERAAALRDRLVGVPYYRLIHAEADGIGAATGVGAGGAAGGGRLRGRDRPMARLCDAAL